MANCLTSIKNTPMDAIPGLSSNVSLPFSISSASNSMMVMRNAVPEVISFWVVLGNVDYEINITVNFYKIEDDGTVQFTGYTIVNELSVNFQKDMQIGNYIICISTNLPNSYYGAFLGLFTSFPPYALMSANIRIGELSNKLNVDIPIIKKKCDYPLFYELIGGELPPGITLEATGWLRGILPDLDCIEENAELSGSQNWYFQSGSSWHPWGRQWRFLVRVYIHPSITDEAEDQEWFCIAVYNNWDWDRDNFMNNKPFEKTVEILEKEVPEYHLGDICCENVEVPVINNINISKIVLCPCEQNKKSIEEEEKLSKFLRWYLQFGNQLEASNLYSPEMIKFIDNFKETVLYQSLINKVKDQTLVRSKEEIEKIALEAYIKDIENRQINGRFDDHIDHQMLQKKDNVNQTLPMSGWAYEIVLIQCTLDSEYFPPIAEKISGCDQFNSMI